MAFDTNTRETVRPSRRTVVRGAAWSVPVVSMAATAPAFAASACIPRSADWRLDWGTTDWAVSKPSLDGVHTGVATIDGPSNSTPIVVTFTSTMVRSSAASRRADENLTVSTVTNVGGLGAAERALNISHDTGIVAGRGNYRQEVAIKFNRAITNLAFTVTDIDSQAAAQNLTWSDRVAFSPDISTYAAPTGSEVVGRGRFEGETATNRGPFRRTASENVGNVGDNSGNVNVNYAARAANSAFTLTFWTETAGGNQRIFLSDFTFTASTC